MEVVKIAGSHRIMIFSPHEDDETLVCSCIIKNAADNGDEIKLVLVTTGDYSDPRARLIRTINATGLLGLNKSDIVYLGYGDHDVLGPAYMAKDNPKKIFPGTHGSKTYGFRDIGIIDYHFIKHGYHGDYNRENIFIDIYEVLMDNLPHDIYIPSRMEIHADHSSTGLFVISALLEIKKGITYSPAIHEYMIYKHGLQQNNLNSLEPVMNT